MILWGHATTWLLFLRVFNSALFHYGVLDKIKKHYCIAITTCEEENTNSALFTVGFSQNLMWLNSVQGFSGGSGVKNPAANAGDMDLISDPRWSHMPLSNCWICSRSQEPQLLKPLCPEPMLHKRNLPVRSTCTSTKSSPHSPQLEKNLCTNEDPAQSNLNK